jgi:hypothetical protein
VKGIGLLSQKVSWVVAWSNVVGGRHSGHAVKTACGGLPDKLESCRPGHKKMQRSKLLSVKGTEYRPVTHIGTGRVGSNPKLI